MDSSRARTKRRRIRRDLDLLRSRLRNVEATVAISDSSTDTAILNNEIHFEDQEQEDDFVSCVDGDDLHYSDCENFNFDSDVSPNSSESEYVRSNDSEHDTGNESHCEESSDEENEGPNFRDLFAMWAITWGICQNAVDALLAIFRLFQWGLGLPRSCRTLLKTPRRVNVKPMSPGKYYHHGILKGLESILNFIPQNNIPDNVEIFVSIDGLPISKSSGAQFWPILGMISNGKIRKIFLIGLYHGDAKPDSTNEYSSEFISEARDLREKGFSFKGRQHTLTISAFICDAPARSYVLNTKGHTGYFGCGRCIQQGEFEGRVVFLERDSTLRTDETFRNRIHEEHHHGESPLERIEYLDMVRDFPGDPMHLFDLGVTRKLFITWVRGPLPTRLHHSLVDVISSRLETLSEFIPREFARATRSLKFLDRFKATEFGLMNSCVGPVILRGILRNRLYNNFIVFHVAVRILSSFTYCVLHNDYARQLLNLFVEECQAIYGAYFLSFNVHNLIHSCDDVMRFGPLPNFSAYPFENYLFSLKRLLRKSHQALQQVVKRLLKIIKYQDAPLRNEKRGKGRFSKPHDSGPLINRLIGSKQFKEMQLGPWFLSCKAPDNCVFLNDLTILCIENIIRCANGDFIIGKRFQIKNDLFSYPLPSSSYEIFAVSNKSQAIEAWGVGEIKCKAVLLPTFVGNTARVSEGTWAVFPLLMESHT